MAEVTQQQSSPVFAQAEPSHQQQPRMHSVTQYRLDTLSPLLTTLANFACLPACRQTRQTSIHFSVRRARRHALPFRRRGDDCDVPSPNPVRRPPALVS